MGYETKTTIWDVIVELFPCGTPLLELDVSKKNKHSLTFLNPIHEDEKGALIAGEKERHEGLADDIIQRLTDDPAINPEQVTALKLKDEDALCSHSWLLCPSTPIDLFVVTARLLEISGAYHHFTNLMEGIPPVSTPPNKGDKMTNSVHITDPQRNHYREYGRLWRETPTSKDVRQAPPPVIEWLWLNLVLNYNNEPVFSAYDPNIGIPDWWRFAFTLFMIADEASSGVGQSGHISVDKKSWCQIHVDEHIKSETEKLIQNGGTLFRQDEAKLYTISNANPDIACVLPKSRTSQVGCALRCFSRNLALLPPRGVARVNWVYGQPRTEDQQLGKALNLLLIPYPYEAPASVFKPNSIKSDVDDSNGEKSQLNKPYGFFDIDLPKKGSSHDKSVVSEFVNNLIEKAKEDMTQVDIVVFPELSLSNDLHNKIIEMIAEQHPEVEVLVAGLNSLNYAMDGEKFDVRPGNYAAITIFSDGSGKDSDGKAKREYFTTHHLKHHRWCLDREQIKTYSLGSSLDPSKLWWENHAINSRRLTVMSFRQRATATVLICEDLARSDPAQKLLRAIGPKLIFALLMDGPQLKSRWPARYATVLADDPGSSVLTLTSLALINRTNSSGEYEPSRCIGLWRDAQGSTHQLELAKNHHALGVSLSEVAICDQTIDGRESTNGSTWTLSGVVPLKSEKGPPVWMR